jgi:hypothetical protein
MHLVRKRLTIMVLAAFFCFVPALATGPTVRPEDCPDTVAHCPCNGFPEPPADDTPCWQWALEQARTQLPDFPYFGAVVGTSGAHYYISGTLVLRTALGGEINGNGALLEWTGPYVPYTPYYGQTPPSGTDPSWGTPMFRFENTQQLRITNLKILSTSSHPLEAAIEFTHAPADTEHPFANVNPSANIIDHVHIEGQNADCLDYAIRFSKRYNIDGNNDQSTIMNTTIYGVMKAAISIEHSQSHQHRFYAVNAYAASGNETVCTDESDADPLGCVPGAEFIRLKGGGFTSIGGFRWNFQNAEFYVTSIFTPVTIIDSNSEGCAHFIRTPSGWAPVAFPVHVIGGRFAVDGLAADDRIVSWERQGPLSIRGLQLEGTPPGGLESHHPRFYLHPLGTEPGDPPYEGDFQIENVFSYVANSTTWDLIDAGPFARVVTSGNMCDNSSAHTVGPCSGLAAGMSASSGVTFAGLTSLANIPLLNGHWTYCSDCTPHTSPCTGGGTGTMARRLTGAWDCEGGVVLSSDASVTYDSEWDTVATVNAHVTDGDFATLAGAESLTNKDMSADSNWISTTGTICFVGSPSRTSPQYCPPYSGTCNATESTVSIAHPSLRPRSLYCKVTAQPGNNKSWTFRARAGGNDLLTCAISGSATECSVLAGSPPSESPRWSEGAELSLRVEPLSSPASANVTCVLGVGP